ncbi:MAG: cell division protein SepF [Thermaerobacter sp.]|nr:cell division protein SepF [Thermaerobacter sp.]
MGMVDKLLNFIGFEELPEEQPEKLNGEEVSWYGGAAVPEKRKKRPHLVSLPGSKAQVRMVVLEPRTFEEAQQIADHLKSNRPVILNFEAADKDTAQRIINFLSGSVYALDGQMTKAGPGVFLFAPANVEVMASDREVLRDGMLGLWNE